MKQLALHTTVVLGLFGTLMLGSASVAQDATKPKADEATKQSAKSQPDRWESEIAAFEKSQKDNPRAPGGVVFVGSSSIRLWNLDESFPELKPINRGFGGSQIADSTRYVARILVPLKPRQLLLYAGDNDVAAGKDANAVVADFQQFVNTVFAALPETKIAFIAIKPSVKRWDMWPVMKSANDRIATLCEDDSRLEFVDISSVTLGADGQPDASLFAKDGLHLNEAGYRRWTAKVRDTLGW